MADKTAYIDIRQPTPKQAQFCRNYVNNEMTLQEAYFNAFNTSKMEYASICAARLVKKPEIRAYIKDLMRQRSEAIYIDLDVFLVDNLVNSTQTTIQDFIDPDTGEFKPLQDIDKRRAKALTKYKIQTTTKTDKEGNQSITKSIDIALVDKVQLLRELAKYSGFYKNDYSARAAAKRSAPGKAVKDPRGGKANQQINNFYNYSLQELEQLKQDQQSTAKGNDNIPLTD